VFSRDYIDFKEVIVMEEMFDLTVSGLNKARFAQELKECNEFTGQFGLSLSGGQIQNLVERRFEALGSTGRVEFGDGITKKLIREFCDSPYIMQENYEETILELQDSFYYFKNESEDRITDDELIAFMRRHFDTTCQGSLEYLSGTTLEDLCRNTRYGYRDDDKDIYGHTF
jgi:hypothetical protein